MPIFGVNIYTSFIKHYVSQPPKLIFPQLFNPRLIDMYKDSHARKGTSLKGTLLSAGEAHMAMNHNVS